MDKQKLLFISTRGPWQGSNALACADALMTSAILDQECRLLLTGDGVYQLIKNQDGSSLGQESMARLLPALELYEVEEVLVDKESLVQRGISESDLAIPVTVSEASALRALSAICDQVLVF